MNKKQLDQLLSTLLADSSTNFYTEDERILALNTACKYINSELQLLRTVADITVTETNQGRVPLPTNFVSFGKGVQWVTATGQVTTLELRVPLQLQMGLSTDWENATGQPTSYVLEGGNLYITPYPIESGILRLSYVAMPNMLQNDDDIPFWGDVRTQAYHEMISYYAAWQLCLKDRDFEAAQQFMQYFQSRMIDLKENLRHTGGLVQPVWSDTYSTA